MGLASALRAIMPGHHRSAADRAPAPKAMAGDAQVYVSLDDPALLEAIRAGMGGGISVATALRNPAVLRSVDLIAGVIGRLPLYLRSRGPSGAVVNETAHPLYACLMHRPNGWQNANQFKSLMQTWVLVHGNAYALIVRRGQETASLVPLHPNRVSVEQLPDFSLRYTVTGRNNTVRVYGAADILHLRGHSDDGVTGWSPVRQAADVIEGHVAAMRAGRRVFDNGLMAGGILTHPGKLDKDAQERLRASMQAYVGADNTGKIMIAEEGLSFEALAPTSVDAQLVEFRSALVEDIGRVFGVPRPLLGVDDTSWGTGVEQLAILFVRFGLAPWFDVWEQAIKVSCLRASDWDRLYVDFDERELLRGTLKEQFEAYARAAGAGGHKPWMEPNEIRDDLGMGAHPDGTGLKAAGDIRREQADSSAP